MTAWDLVVAIILAAFFAVAVYVAVEFGPRARTTLALWRTIRKTGLKAIYPRSHPKTRNQQLLNILQDAMDRDEILMVGRTHKGLLEVNEQAILKALERGVVIKILFLDQKILTNLGPGQHFDLRSLGLPNAYVQLLDDVGAAVAKLRALKDECRKRKVWGSLLVFRTVVLVQSSVVVYVPLEKKTPMRLLYDFSFGGEDSDKFVQYYRSPQTDSAGDFCNRLRKFYASLYEPDISAFSYELSYRYSRSDPLEEIEKLATERITNLIKAHEEVEKIRNNSLERLVPAAASVFAALSSDSDVPAPISAQIELTNACSTQCTHCFRYSKIGEPHMETGLARRILDQLHEFGVRTITLSGGEPTKHPDFGNLLQYAAVDKKLAVGVLSNGVGVSKNDLARIQKHARWLRLSIDGSPTVYGQIRSISGKDAFPEVSATIEQFIRLNEIGRRCQLSICYTIQKRNADDVPEMITWVRSLGLPNDDKCLTFKFAHGRNGFLCSKPQLEMLAQIFLKPEFRDSANLPYLKWFLERQSSIRDVEKGRPTESLYLQQPTRCFTPHLFTLIDPHGDVYPCCFLFEDNQGYTAEAIEKRRAHCLGSLKTQSFREIWNGTKYQQVRDELASINPKAKKYEACGECTRHCNHNRSLSQLYSEYAGLQAAGGDAISVIKGAMGPSGEDVWL